MLRFEKPEVSSLPKIGTPVAIANIGFPYYEIADDRRFEELIYAIHKLKIDHGNFDSFDSISLMTGVRDLGRDCVLYKGNKPYGVIQCKKYNKPYSKSELGQEITKFVLYSLIDDRLIYDSSEFTYYIATAKGLAADCIEFVNDFNNLICNEPSLNTWIGKCLERPTLSSLKLTLNIDDFRDKLSKITIKNITPQDLDLELSNPLLSYIIPLFFEVRTVTDNSKLEELKQFIRPTITKQQIIDSFQISSVSLYAEKNEFSSLENSNIPRKETNDLYNWIITENTKQEENKNISLLVGPAGYGKTIILKDLYDKCVENNIAILGLKADKIYPQSLEDLQKITHSPLPLIEFIQESKKHFTKIVILIDQLDALSQSMSSDRRFLNIFRSFIDIFLKDENVRIILSVRPYELSYDPSLQFYKNSNTFHLKPLSEKEVKQTLKKAAINPDTLSSKLLELLSIPNQLDVFLRIATDGANRIQSVSIHGLYVELWRQKVTELIKLTNRLPNSLSVKKLLYTIAKDMFDSQRISVTTFKYEDYHKELSYLESERLIKRDGNQIQFFHQSFYDFTFSKQLVENEVDIIHYIKDQEQSIHIRSAVRMIFSYLRDYDSRQYIVYMRSIFEDDDIFFHIKHVLFSLIISLDNPSLDETTLVKAIIQDNIHLELLFLEMATAPIWFAIASDKNYLQIANTNVSNLNEDDKHKRQLALSFIQNQIINHNSREAWKMLSDVPEKKDLQNIMYSITDWSSPVSYDLFESCKDFEVDDLFGYYHVLNNIGKQNEDYVINKLSSILPKDHRKTNRSADFEEREVLKALAKQCPEKLYPILLNCILSDIGQDNHYSTGLLLRDWIYGDVNFVDNEDNIEEAESIYQLLAICLKRTAQSNFNTHIKFLNEYKDSKYESILRLILFTLRDNEKEYSNQIFDVFATFIKSKIIEEDEGLEYELRVLIENAFKYFSRKQRAFIINYIKTCKRSKEIFYYTYGDPPKKRFQSRWGISKYFWLKRLPKEILTSDIELRKTLQELQRLYGNKKDKAKERNSLAMIGTHSPIPPSAYQRMSKKQWIAAFQKYDSNYKEDFFSSKGGLHELASGFKSSILENPSNEKLEILVDISNDRNIDTTYVFIALQGFAEKRKDLRDTLVEILKIAISREDHKDMYYPVQIASELIGSSIEHPYLFALLAGCSLNYNENDHWITSEKDDKTTRINGLVTSGLNTIYGAAIEAITQIKDPNYKNSIFDVIEKVLSSGPAKARALLYFRLAYLTHLDITKTNELFVKHIAKEEDVYVIASSLWSLQYLGKSGFTPISIPYEKLIESSLLGRDDARSLFIILYGSYLYEIEGAKELLYKYIKSSNQATLGGINEIFKNYYRLPNSKEKNDDLLFYILREIDIDDENDFAINFLHIEHIKLADIYQFLLNYIQSPIFAISNYLVDYLCHQCVHEPIKAIELFDLAFDKHINSVKDKGKHRLDESLIRFIVGAYDSLTLKNDEHINNRKKLLKRFDQVLQDYRLRRSAEKILEKLT